VSAVTAHTDVSAAATRVLERNWRGGYTVPAGGLYPHQWSWDSAFIAIGLRHISPRRAQLELDSLLSAQWADGRLPQIVFDRGRDDDYSPGGSFWNSERIAGAPGVSTAGLVQPPNHALAALLVHEADPAESRRRSFLERVYPRLVAWHEYLRRRRSGDSGLARIVHPWESGMDNSPYWDAPLAAVGGGSPDAVPRPDLRHADATHRPSNAEYRKYLHLAARYRDHDCDDDDDHPFLLEDPAVNAIWARSESALAAIATELGLDAAAARHTERATEITDALESLWHPAIGCYVARDARTGELQPFRTVSGLVPLLLAEVAHAPELLDTLRGEHFALGAVALVPSHDLTAETFDPARYWRGPSWFNTAWLIIEGLETHGAGDEARAMARQAWRLAVDHGFPEYVDPHSSAPRGTLEFSWTAALALDLHTRFSRGERS
jgi:hypothetical protein